MEGCNSNEDVYPVPMRGNLLANANAYEQVDVPRGDFTCETQWYLIPDQPVHSLEHLEDDQVTRSQIQMPLFYFSRTDAAINRSTVVRRINIHGTVGWNILHSPVIQEWTAAQNPAFNQPSVFLALVHDSGTTTFLDDEPAELPLPLIDPYAVFDLRLQPGLYNPTTGARYLATHLPGTYSRRPGNPSRYNVLWYENFVGKSDDSFFTVFLNGTEGAPAVYFRELYFHPRRDTFRASIECEIPVSFSYRVDAEHPNLRLPETGNVFLLAWQSVPEVPPEGAELGFAQTVHLSCAVSFEYESSGH